MTVYHQVRERDQSCKLCGSYDFLEVHHIKYRSQGGKDEAANLILLCRDHHLKAHSEPFLRWKLFAKLKFPHISWRALNDSGLKLCMTCDYMDVNKRCTLWDEQTWDENVCPSWKIRTIH